MFGNCIWAELIETNNFFKINKIYLKIAIHSYIFPT